MTNKKRIAVAMSGGVDSSLTAALLIRRGFEVVGVTMILSGDGEVSDAEKVAAKLGIAHYVADFRREFRAEIEDYFVAEYLKGRTPNPCVRCNKKIKFGKLFEFAETLGANFLATGHYARIVHEGGRYRLMKALDVRKDQSYVLYNLTAESLSRIILPLGEFSKAETRALAEEVGLHVAQKPDSQEICFIPNNDYKSFLEGRCRGSQALRAGEIVDATGKVLGVHSGVANYTVGQRKGLGIAAPEPLYVLKLDVENKRVVVGSNAEVFASGLTAEDVHWIYEPKFPARLQAKIRYGPRVAWCTVYENLRVEFDEPQRAVTAGQSVVFYDGEEVLGGGIIAETL